MWGSLLLRNIEYEDSPSAAKDPKRGNHQDLGKDQDWIPSGSRSNGIGVRAMALPIQVECTEPRNGPSRRESSQERRHLF